MSKRSYPLRDTSLVLILCLLASTSLLAQKVEREYRIRKREVPASIFNFLDSAFAEQRSLKFYEDIDEGGSTIEAKFTCAEQRYSVEFLPDGSWRDTEVEVALSEVPTEVWSQACTKWDNRFERYRVVRVQWHVDPDGGRYYEVELKNRIDFTWMAFQYRIAADGSLLDAIEIELSPGHLSPW